MKEYTAEMFTSNRCFKEYWNGTGPGDSFNAIEEWAKVFVEEHFENEDVEEWNPDGCLAYSVLERGLEELPEVLASEIAGIRMLARRKYMELKLGIKWATPYLDIWNVAWAWNGETHGAVFAMCFKSEDGELRNLGKRILEDLIEIRGTTDIGFDT